MKFITIIIPVFNADQYIGQCLSALQRLDYPKDHFEIIVVDNGSTDKTLELVRSYSIEPWVLPKVNVSHLRNFAAKKAKGDVLAFIDADCVAPSVWLKQAVQVLNNTNPGAVGCWYQLPKVATLLEKVWDSHMGLRRQRRGSIDWVPSGNLIVPRYIFERIGGFNESLNTCEDVDICRRIREIGLSVFSHPDLAVIHLGESKNFRHFLLKEKWRGEGVLQDFIHEFPHLRWNKALAFTATTFIAMLFMAWGLLWGLLSHEYTLLMLAAVLLLAIPLYLTFKACTSSRQWQYFIPLTALFLVYASGRMLSIFNLKIWQNEITRI